MNNPNKTTTTVTRYSVTLDALDIDVISQLGGTACNVGDACEIEADAADQLANVCRSSYGAAGGFPGFIYYHETREFFKANRDEIAARLREQIAEGLFEGAHGVVSAVMSFNCFKNCDADEIEEEAARAFFGPASKIDGGDLDNVANACAWYALEDLAFRLDGQRIEDDETANDTETHDADEIMEAWKAEQVDDLDPVRVEFYADALRVVYIDENDDESREQSEDMTAEEVAELFGKSSGEIDAGAQSVEVWG